MPIDVPYKIMDVAAGIIFSFLERAHNRPITTPTRDILAKIIGKNKGVGPILLAA